MKVKAVSALRSKRGLHRVNGAEPQVILNCPLMLAAGLRLSRRLAKCILFLVADLHGSGRAKGAKADGKRIGPSGFGVRPPAAAGERIGLAKAVAGHRIPGRRRDVADHRDPGRG